jgi:hypothetical protein
VILLPRQPCDSSRFSSGALKILGAERFDSGRLDVASSLFDEMMTGAKYHDFLTLEAYACWRRQLLIGQ